MLIGLEWLYIHYVQHMQVSSLDCCTLTLRLCRRAFQTNTKQIEKGVTKKQRPIIYHGIHKTPGKLVKGEIQKIKKVQP